jgi:hypothetical protein
VTDLRQSRPEPPAPYARGTRVDVERSRRELEAFLAARGASDFIVLQDEASARVRFALYGNYFELVLPLPDPQSRAFSHTPTGRPRTPAGQQRAYNQTLREKWRVLLFVTRGKLQAVESGISSLDQEFVTAFLPAAAWPEEAKTVASGGVIRAGAWRRVSRTVVGALGAGLLVPASALSAFALPGAAVDRVAGLVWSDKPALFAQSDPAKPALVALPNDPGGSGETLLLSLPAPSSGVADVTGGNGDESEGAGESGTSSDGNETQTVEAESGDDGSVDSGATEEEGSDSMETGDADPAVSSGSPTGGEIADTGGAGTGSDKGKGNGGGNGKGNGNGGGGNGNGGGEGNGKGNGNGGGEGNGQSKGNGGEDKGKGNDTGDGEGGGGGTGKGKSGEDKGNSGEDKGNGGAAGNGEGKGNGGGGDKGNPGGGESKGKGGAEGKGNGGAEGKGKGNGGAKGSTGS